MAPSKPMSYEEARVFTASALLRAAEAHERGDYPRIQKEYEVLDCGLPREAGPEFDKLFIALHFWEGWWDSSNHGWNFYEPLTARDWPGLAREIAENLRAGSEISNPEILRQFNFKDRPQSPSLIQQLKGWLGFSKLKDSNG